MNTTPDFKVLLDLACERSISTSPFIARHYYEETLKYESRKAHMDDINKRACAVSQRTLIVCAVLVFSLLALALSVSLKDSSEFIQAYSVRIEMTSLVLCIISCVTGLSLSGKRQQIDAEKPHLVPIGEDPAQCLALKELTAQHNSVAHYVKNTVDRFEQLTAGDVAVARALAAGEEKFQRNEKGRAACLELHAFATANAK